MTLTTMTQIHSDIVYMISFLSQFAHNSNMSNEIFWSMFSETIVKSLTSLFNTVIGQKHWVSVNQKTCDRELFIMVAKMNVMKNSHKVKHERGLHIV